jgi:RND superfamily putative drug exporter
MTSDRKGKTVDLHPHATKARLGNGDGGHSDSTRAVARLTRWVLAHRRLVVSAWVLITIAAFVAMQPAGKALSEEFTVPGREGFETNRAIAAIYGTGGSDVTPIVPVVTLPDGTTVDSPGVTDELSAAMARLEAVLPEARIASYASTDDRAFVSADGRTTFGLVYIPARGGLEPGQEEARTAEKALDGVTVGGAQVRVTGLDALRASSAGEDAGASVTLLAEVLVASVGALLVLAFVFASFMAVVPLLIAAVAIPTTFLLVWPLAAVTEVSIVVQFLVALVGLGIAIDYALLVVVRWREEHRRGVDNETAVQNAMEHAGSAVVFSGTTVAIAMLALLTLPVPFLRSIGIAGMLIPLVSVAVAITLLPVILASVGPRLDWPRIRREDRASRAWSAWARAMVRRRWAAGITSAAVLVALVVAASTIQLGNPRAEALAQAGEARTALQELKASEIGPGPLSPFEALVRDGDAEAVAATLAEVDGVRGAVAPIAWRHDRTALVTVIPAVDGNSPAGHALLDRVRTTAHGLDADVSIGGQAAQSADFVDAVYGNFPLMIALIGGFTFVLLARAFRSLVLPLKAVLLNLLSVAAAWGLMVIVWQHGFGSSAIWGIEPTGSINAEMPVVVFAFLFGLSMDYQVFIISRMREAYDRTGSTDAAVVEGIGRTGRLVTSAALILGLAFVALSASPGTEIKIFATALAAGILLDATIVRGMLVPASVSILGRWNWWLPQGPARVLRVAPSTATRKSTMDEA